MNNEIPTLNIKPLLKKVYAGKKHAEKKRKKDRYKGIKDLIKKHRG